MQFACSQQESIETDEYGKCKLCIQECELKSCDASGSSIAATKDICVMATSSLALPSNGLEKGKAEQNNAGEMGCIENC